MELVQERRNSSALAMELRLSCTGKSNCCHVFCEAIFLEFALLIDAIKWASQYVVIWC